MTQKKLFFNLKTNAMKTTSKNFESKTLTHSEMRDVDGGVWQYIVGGAAALVGGYLLYRDYKDAKNEVLTGEYTCPCQNN